LLQISHQFVAKIRRVVMTSHFFFHSSHQNKSRTTLLKISSA
jgi:hypothetical protein